MRWLRNLLGWNQSRKTLDGLNAAIRFSMEWEIRAGELRVLLEQDRKNLEKLSRQIEAASARLDVNLREAERVGNQQEKAVAALRDELQILKEVSLPVLIASHKLLLQRYDTETQIEVKKAAIASPD